MALFAKRLDYWASEVEYSAVLAIAKKKGGNPTSYIVYSCEVKGVDGRFVMRAFFSHDEARRHVALRSRDEFMVTSPWLNHVATGFSGGGWMRVPTPRIGARKRRRKLPMFGDLGFLYRIARAEESEANERVKAVESQLDELFLEYGPDARSMQSFQRLEAEKMSADELWCCAYDKWARVRYEIEVARSKSTGIPISKTSIVHLLMNK